jgi:hypothetical protein
MSGPTQVSLEGEAAQCGLTLWTRSMARPVDLNPTVAAQAEGGPDGWWGVVDAPYDWPTKGYALGRWLIVSVLLGNETVAARIWPSEADRPPATLGVMRLGASRYGDARGSRLWALQGLGPVPQLIADPPPRAESSEVIGRTDARSIRLASIDMVERLTHTVEDAAQTEPERAMARAVRAYLEVLRTFVIEPPEPELEEIVLRALRETAERLLTLTKYAGLVRLGLELRRLLD